MARKQPTKKHRAPTRVRYDATHPALTVHFDLETYARVVELSQRSGLTRSEVVRRGLGAVESSVDAVLARGHEEGLQEGQRAGYAEGRSTGAADAHSGGYKAGRAAGYDEGYRAGSQAAVAIYRITVPCEKCGQPMEFRRDDTSASIAVRVLTDRGLVHTSCPNRLKYTAL